MDCVLYTLLDSVMDLEDERLVEKKESNLFYKFQVNSITGSLSFYLFYNDYETSYTTYINHARWHPCLR